MYKYFCELLLNSAVDEYDRESFVIYIDKTFSKFENNEKELIEYIKERYSRINKLMTKINQIEWVKKCYSYIIALEREEKINKLLNE